MKKTARAILDELESLGDSEIASHSARFFKTGAGEYGEGDRFFGIRVPVVRRVARKYRGTPMRSVIALLKSDWHEARLLAVLMLVDKYERGSVAEQSEVYDAYLEGRRYINNWDIVDSSAHRIVGPYLEHRSRKRLYRLAESAVLWDRRIAMMATYHFIRQNDFADAFGLARVLLQDEHDLIHKIVGWMLREIGNRDRAAEEEFLERHYSSMPRTMLRYAIERFPEARRKAYLSGTV